jgi:hypothetical protein
VHGPDGARPARRATGKALPARTAPDAADVAAADFLISYTTRDGEEHEERWPSPERFRSWAAATGLRASFTAYREDEDGDWVVVEKGKVG